MISYIHDYYFGNNMNYLSFAILSFVQSHKT